MKPILPTLLLSLLLSSCSDMVRMKYVCSCEQKKEIETFISNNLAPSNNMSDEEMEDVIYELYKTGVKLNCEQRKFIVNHTAEIDWEQNSLDSCETVQPY